MSDFRVFGTHDDGTLEQMRQVSQRTVAAALMADGHKGYVMPIGGVACYEDAVNVNGVGVDIACGNCAIKTDVKLNEIGKSQYKTEFMLNQLADRIADSISFGMGRKNVANDAPTEHELFDDPIWSDALPHNAKVEALKQKARHQLGTVGGGNHYVDVFVDEDDFIWAGVHFGSRGLGFTIANGFLAIGQGAHWGEHVSAEHETILHLKSAEGQAYWEAMQLAGRYAYAGREWVARKVVSMIGGKEVEMVHNHHNFAWKEGQYVGGYWNEWRILIGATWKEVVVVRKGATPARAGQKGFVGGSMGDNAVILEGRDALEIDSQITEELQKEALFSTVHGAGRVMSRTEAAGKRNRKTGELKLDKVTGQPVKPGKVSWDMTHKWLQEKGVILRGGGVDESPHVYRRLPEVLAAQGPTVKVLHTLRPLIVVMAGEETFDPYKD